MLRLNLAQYLLLLKQRIIFNFITNKKAMKKNEEKQDKKVKDDDLLVHTNDVEGDPIGEPDPNDDDEGGPGHPPTVPTKP